MFNLNLWLNTRYQKKETVFTNVIEKSSLVNPQLYISQIYISKNNPLGSSL